MGFSHVQEDAFPEMGIASFLWRREVAAVP